MKWKEPHPRGELKLLLKFNFSFLWTIKNNVSFLFSWNHHRKQIWMKAGELSGREVPIPCSKNVVQLSHPPTIYILNFRTRAWKLLSVNDSWESSAFREKAKQVVTQSHDGPVSSNFPSECETIFLPLSSFAVSSSEMKTFFIIF